GRRAATVFPWPRGTPRSRTDRRDRELPRSRGRPSDARRSSAVSALPSRSGNPFASSARGHPKLPYRSPLKTKTSRRREARSRKEVKLWTVYHLEWGNQPDFLGLITE